MSGTPAPLRALLAGGIDYAGLFPPARLSMPEAVARYAEYLASADRWALGRFVVPGARLGEFAAAAAPHLGAGRPWRLTITAGDSLEATLAELARFSREVPVTRAVADAVEFRVSRPTELRAARNALPPGLAGFAELPLGEAPAPFVAAFPGGSIGGKLRTGGIVAEAIPPADRLVAWLSALLRAAVPFKCTAGLHHPVRGEFPLTYEPGSATATMHGYLNVMLASAALAAGQDEAVATRLLLDTDAGAVAIGDTGIRWRSLFFTTNELERLRATGFAGFGSCSFREPLDEVALLPTP